MNALRCTCGQSFVGIRQDAIERRLADHYGMTVGDIHNLLDLMTDIMDVVVQMPETEKREHESAIRMAEASGAALPWVQEFMDLWEFEADSLC